MIVMWFSMNFIVVITLLMRWPVKSWKLQASKIEITRSWISSLRIFCWSSELTLEVALDLELLALLDLGAIGVKQGARLGDFAQCRFLDGCRRSVLTARSHLCVTSLMTGTSHLGADRAQLSHDLAMHGTDVAAAAFRRRWHVGTKGFFDTKTFAMN